MKKINKLILLGALASGALFICTTKSEVKANDGVERTIFQVFEEANEVDRKRQEKFQEVIRLDKKRESANGIAEWMSIAEEISKLNEEISKLSEEWGKLNEESKKMNEESSRKLAEFLEAERKKAELAEAERKSAELAEAKRKNAAIKRQNIKKKKNTGWKNGSRKSAEFARQSANAKRYKKVK
ncbi:MAG: hypothetical protein LBT69_01765 [Lactobacillales bacterium]|jgi:seryl-tRNA synthetase|nr:hypothetical protein [Lactobacillales bacterium]